MANIADFNQGSGMGESFATDLNVLFGGGTLVLAGAWCTWVLYKSFRAFAGNRLEAHESVSLGIQSLIILAIFIVIFTLS